jgi:DNA-binding transcriptional regulator YiaG
MSNYPKKPFPWCCSNCREQAVYEATVDYTTQMPHDDREYAIKIDGMKIPKCKSCGVIHPDAEALKLLDAALRRAANLLTPDQIRAFRVHANLTEEELGAAVGINTAEVERLEEGGQIQSRVLDNLLRIFFGMSKARQLLTTHQLNTLETFPV